MQPLIVVIYMDHEKKLRSTFILTSMNLENTTFPL